MIDEIQEDGTSSENSNSSDKSKEVITKRSKLGQKFMVILLLLKNIIKKVFSIFFNSDILHIIRPFVYIYLVMKHGKKSWIPIQVSLAMDLTIIFLVFLKLIGA